MKTVLSIISFLLFAVAAQAQNVWNPDTMIAPKGDGVVSKAVGTDSLSSGYTLWIKKEMKAHKHLTHSEHVYVIDGEADMRLGDKWIKVKNGDVIFIPKGVVHAVKVTSKRPLKVLAVQSPYFDGTDREYVND